MALDYTAIGKRIRKIRKRKGLSQITLSEMIDVSPTYLSNIEGGIKSMSLETLVRVANALQASSDELLADNLENALVATNHELSTLLSDCSTYERKVLLEVVEDMKENLRRNKRFLSNEK